MYIRILFLSILIFTLVGGCGTSRSTTGRTIDRSQVSQIQKGVTTREQVVALLGEPTSTSMIGEGRRMMIYSSLETEAKANVDGRMFIPIVGGFFHNTSSETTSRQQMLQIVLSKAGVVEDYEFSDRTSEAEQKSGISGSESNSRTRETVP